mmetsp:Transcript_64105/g.171580  ORF Transcript_64105/g.171580 Transcript_64105/m.171580 type:complete len:242 (+) Transcript_64105:512-1237(+)
MDSGSSSTDGQSTRSNPLSAFKIWLRAGARCGTNSSPWGRIEASTSTTPCSTACRITSANMIESCRSTASAWSKISNRCAETWNRPASDRLDLQASWRMGRRKSDSRERPARTPNSSACCTTASSNAARAVPGNPQTTTPANGANFSGHKRPGCGAAGTFSTPLRTPPSYEGLAIRRNGSFRGAESTADSTISWTSSSSLPDSVSASQMSCIRSSLVTTGAVTSSVTWSSESSASNSIFIA